MEEGKVITIDLGTVTPDVPTLVADLHRLTLHSARVERERDEALAEIERLKAQVTFHKAAKVAQTDRVEQAEAEQDALEEALNEIDALGDLQFGPACRIARNALRDAVRQRDEARVERDALREALLVLKEELETKELSIDELYRGEDW